MFTHVFVAGTFDGFHKGHEALLSRAFTGGQKVTIGLTSDEFVNKYKVIQFAPLASQGQALRSYRPFAERKRNLEDWLDGQGLAGRFVIIAIDDPFEPAASDKSLDALVVTSENRHRGEEINNLRLTRGLAPLVLLEVSLVPAEDGQPISSTRVKVGDIDSAGRLTMPENLRSVLAVPLGKVLSGEAILSSLDAHKKQLIVTVGDMATKTVLDVQITPALSVIDLKVGRQPYHELDAYLGATNADTNNLTSGPGHISVEADKAIDEWAKSVTLTVAKQKIIIINGEEDLLALPVIAYAPLGTVVYYGQPGKGLVEVGVTSETKLKAAALLAQFNTTNTTNPTNPTNSTNQ